MSVQTVEVLDVELLLALFEMAAAVLHNCRRRLRVLPRLGHSLDRLSSVFAPVFLLTSIWCLILCSLEPPPVVM